MDLLTASPVEIKWNASLPIYASEAFLEVVGDDYGWLAGVDHHGVSRCILPYTVLRKSGFRFVRFRVETVPLGSDLEVAEEKAFLQSVLDYFRSKGADVIIPSGNTAIFRTYPDGAEPAPYGTFIKDLNQPEEILLAEMRPSHRQNISKARNAGVVIKSGPEYLEEAYQLVAETMQRSRAAFQSFHEFQSRVNALGEYVKIFVAEFEGVVQGCMVAPFSLHTAYNCYAGSCPEPVRGAMQLLHWEAMREFGAMGVRHFDFQGVRIDPEKGSKQDGIMNYKRGFGGRLVQGYLWKYSLRPVKAMAYSLGIRWLKGGDIVDRERSKLVVS